MDIIGNNFLITIAFTASSPTNAANTAKLFGCSKQQIRSVRNAAAYKRDHGVEAFNKMFEPYEIIDLPINKNYGMYVKFHFDRIYDKRPLNDAEFNVVAEIIENELAKHNIEVSIKKKDISSPFIKNTIDK
jgi:hypothetical protein